MKNKLLCIVMFFIMFVVMFFICDNKELNTKVVNYNGNNLKISIDGVSSRKLPTDGNYYLVNYVCDNANTKVTWNNIDYKLSVSNGTKKGIIACYLEFKSNPFLKEIPVGSYVKYVGNNGCAGRACEGYNANYVSDTDMGYCSNYNFKFHVNGWRVGYVEDDSVALISAGSPECMCSSSGTSLGKQCSSSLIASNINEHNQNMDSIALKYCNSNYIKNGICDSSAVVSNIVHAVDDSDFEKILGSNLENCMKKYSDKLCGYNNGLIDIGGYYWIAFNTTSSSMLNTSYSWEPSKRFLDSIVFYESLGVRPVLSLESSVVVVGGNGTYDNPYEIDNNYFNINNGVSSIDTIDEIGSVQLSLHAVGDVSTMCISVNTSACTNYIEYSDTYTLDWSNEASGEKVVYVYYKDNNGNIVSSMSRSVTLNS